MIPGLGNFAALMKQAQQIGGRLQGMREELKNRRTTGSAGGGMVEVEVNGLQEVLACRIDAGVFQQGDRELIEDLVAAATNQALTKSRQMQAEAMQEAAGGLELPGIQEALSRLAGLAGAGDDSPPGGNQA